MRYYFSVRRAIPDYKGLYSATTDGRIYSERSKKYLRPADNGKGYQTVVLSKNGKSKTYKVHRLVAMTFLENPNNLPCINHKDENKLNNRVENLEYCTIEYNNQYGSHSKAIYCVELGKVFPSIRAAAKELCISNGSLNRDLNKNNGKCVYNGLHFEYVEKEFKNQ